MGEAPIDDSRQKRSAPDSGRSAYDEYGDALKDVLEDQARRTELRAREGASSRRRKIHPAVAPVLAAFSFWLWLFPPGLLVPNVPDIPPANQEAGLRMGMYYLLSDIRQYELENGQLPGELEAVGESPEGISYMLLTSSLFQLNGQVGDVFVEYRSNEPVEDLLANAVDVVSGTASSAGGDPNI